MDAAELKRRKAELLDGGKLKKEVNKLLKNKGFNAKCFRADNILTGVKPDEKDGTIVAMEEDVGKADQPQTVLVIIYIPSDIYYEDKFTGIDSGIPGRLSIDNRILLRALRVAFNVVKDIDMTVTTQKLGVSKPIKVWVDGDGRATINYDN